MTDSGIAAGVACRARANHDHIEVFHYTLSGIRLGNLRARKISL